MTDPDPGYDRDISEFDPLESKSLPDISRIAYAREEDDWALTDAGRVNDFYVKVLERLYVAEQMAAVSLEIHRSLAGRFKILTPGEVPKITQSIIKHAGASEFVHLAIYTLKISDHWRGPGRLCNISTRILLGRAKSRLAHDPDDTHAEQTLRQSRIALGRNPHTGIKNDS